MGLSVILTDLHSLVGSTVMYTALSHDRRVEPIEATEHFALAIRHVNMKLSDKESACADSTIAVVASLMVRANIMLSPSQARIHLDGLQRILSLRPGGFGALRTTHLALFQKICRVDIEVALFQGTATRFGRDCPALSLDQISSPAEHQPQLPELLDTLSQSLRNITNEVFTFCRACEAGVKINAHVYQEINISVLQKLLDFAPLGGRRPEESVDDLWQLGLLAFMTTLPYSGKGLLHYIYSRRLLKLLRERLDATQEREESSGMAILKLWSLFMYGFKILEEGENLWLTAQLNRLRAKLDLEDWGQTNQLLQRCPWIGLVHDGLGKALWEATISVA